MSTSNTPLIKNPSRSTCETIIQRILMTEVLHKGENRHFKKASDFMNYFESLYPPSDSLTKQVQRAVKSMKIPKDEQGYFIVNKTSVQIEQDQALRTAFTQADVKPIDLTEYTPVFLSAKPSLCPYLKELLLNSITFQNKFQTIIESSGGLLLYTDQPKQLVKLCESFLKVHTS